MHGPAPASPASAGSADYSPPTPLVPRHVARGFSASLPFTRGLPPGSRQNARRSGRSLVMLLVDQLEPVEAVTGERHEVGQLADRWERHAAGQLDRDLARELLEHELAGLREPGQVVDAQHDVFLAVVAEAPT